MLDTRPDKRHGRSPQQHQQHPIGDGSGDARLPPGVLSPIRPSPGPSVAVPYDAAVRLQWLARSTTPTLIEYSS